MGTVAAGLGSIGSALARAQELKRKEEFEKAKLAMEQGNLSVSQRYAQLREKELGIESEREKRLAQTTNQPAYLGHIVAPDGSLLYGMQAPDGKVTFTKLPYSADTTGVLEGLSKGIDSLPKEAQPSARAAVGGLVQLGRYKEAQTELDKYLLQYGKSQMPGTETVRTTTGTKQVWVDDPEHPGKQKMVEVPTSSTSVTKKVPAAPKGTPAAPSKGKPTAPATPVATLTKTAPGVANKIYAGFQKWEDAKSNLDIMRKDVAAADAVDAKGDPKSAGAFDMDLLSRHISMTFGAVKNVRGGQYLIEHHIKARSLPDSLVVMYGKLKNGEVLSPAQRKNFVDLAEKRIIEYSREYNDTRALAGYPPDPRMGSETGGPQDIDSALDKLFPKRTP
jgi:hypothetical protein